MAETAEKVTQLPWRLEQSVDDLTYVVMDEGDSPNAPGFVAIAEMCSQANETKANAEFIVKAVNHHKELVDALRQALREYRAFTVLSGETLAQCDAVLAKVLVGLCLSLVFAGSAYAQPCGPLSPAAQALLPAFLSAEAGTPPAIYTNGDLRAFPQAQKSVMTYRVLNSSLASYVRDSMRFWAAIVSCPGHPVIAVELPASDDTAMHTWRLGNSVTFPCPTPITVPLTNGAGMPWTTLNCDRVTYTKWEYVFTSPSRYLTGHEFSHNYRLKHTPTGIFAKKQTCNWNNNITPEQNALSSCWLTAAEREVVRFLHWSDPKAVMP